MFPAIFLDRDGVIIENREDYVRDWSQVKILPEALDAIVNFQHKHHYRFIIVTNQSAIGRGLMSIEAARDINELLVKTIEARGGKVHGVYLCPHTPEDRCNCRKPEPGMFFQAARDLSIDLNRSWMVGDAWSDLLAGQAAGLRDMILVQTGRGADQLSIPVPEKLTKYHICADLPEALVTISLQEERPGV